MPDQILVSYANYIDSIANYCQGGLLKSILSFRNSRMSESIEDIASGLNSTAIHLIRRVKKQDSKLNVGPARLSALSVLVFGGSCSLSELAGYEQVTSATMSRIVSGLEQNGLVQRHPSKVDARAILVVATTKGRRLMHRGQKARVRSLARELRQLSDTDLQCLQRAVEILREVESNTRGAAS